MALTNTIDVYLLSCSAIFYICFLNPTKNPVANKEIIFPSVKISENFSGCPDNIDRKDPKAMA